MAKGRKQGNRRRRRGGSGFLYRLISMVLIAAVVVTALTLFFRVDEVLITGQQRYTAEEIRKASGVEQGDNLFLLNKHEVSASLGRELPYIESLHIRRRAPDTLILEVRECQKPLALIQDGFAWLISPSGEPNGKIVDQLPVEEAEGYGRIEGCKLLAPAVNTRIKLKTELELEQQALQKLMAALAEKDMMEAVDAIHLEDPSVLRLDLYGRFTLLLRYDADFSLKLKNLQAILESGKIQDNMRGSFDMRSEDGKTNFIPKSR